MLHCEVCPKAGVGARGRMPKRASYPMKKICTQAKGAIPQIWKMALVTTVAAAAMLCDFTKVQAAEKLEQLVMVSVLLHGGSPPTAGTVVLPVLDDSIKGVIKPRNIPSPHTARLLGSASLIGSLLMTLMVLPPLLAVAVVAFSKAYDGLCTSVSALFSRLPKRQYRPYGSPKPYVAHA